MPTIKKRGPRKKLNPNELTYEKREFQHSGHNLLSQPEPPFRTDEETRETWEKHRDLLMADIGSAEWQWVVPYGSRPWAWWKWEAPERRRILCRAENALWDEGISFGKARLSVGGYADRPIYETQFEYLKRLGLLMEDEEQMMLEAQRRERQEKEKLKELTRKRADSDENDTENTQSAHLRLVR